MANRSGCVLPRTPAMLFRPPRATGISLRRAVVLLAVGMPLGLAGCGGLDPVATYEQITDPARLFMSLTIDHPAVNLSTAAPFNTQQLTATPRNALGQPMDGLPAPTFRLDQETDSIRVTVTPSGLLTAKDATDDPVLVIAELRTSDNIRRLDSTLVTVTTNPTPPVLASFSIDPVAPDSGVWYPFPHGNNFVVIATAVLFFSGSIVPQGAFPAVVTPKVLDAVGDPIPGLTIEYVSLDPTIAAVDRRTGHVDVLRPGSVQVVAQTTAYGVTKVDTASYIVRLPGWQVIGYATPFQPAEVKLFPNGYVFWLNGDPAGTEAADVTFDDPTNIVSPPPAVCNFIPVFARAAGDYCGAGNFTLPVRPIPNSPYSGVRVRQFPVPGVYPYHTSTGASGRIIVTDTP